MASKLQIEFIKQLIEKTQEKKIPWSMDVNNRVFSNIGDLTVLLNREDGYNGTLISVVIFKGGDQIDRITDEDFEPYDLSEDATKSAFDMMGNLLHVARRQALGADVALEYLINKLAS